MDSTGLKIPYMECTICHKLKEIVLPIHNFVCSDCERKPPGVILDTIKKIEEIQTVMKSGAVKNDGAKLRWRNVPLYLLEPIMEIAFIDDNFIPIDYSKFILIKDLLDKALHNISTFLNPKCSDYIPHDGLSCLAHAAWKLVVAEEMRRRLATGQTDIEAESRMSNIPLYYFEPIIEVGQFGEKKYDIFNYLKGISINSLLDAALRHISAFINPQKSDFAEDSNLSHLAHAAWNLIVAEEMRLRSIAKDNEDLDDRYKG